jgi:hypothetical protein
MTPSEAKRKIIAAINRRHKADHKEIGGDSYGIVASWDEHTSWELKDIFLEIVEDAFKEQKTAHRRGLSKKDAAIQKERNAIYR